MAIYDQPKNSFLDSFVCYAERSPVGQVGQKLPDTQHLRRREQVDHRDDAYDSAGRLTQIKHDTPSSTLPTVATYDYPEIPPASPSVSPMEGKWFADCIEGAQGHGTALYKAIDSA